MALKVKDGTTVTRAQFDSDLERTGAGGTIVEDSDVCRTSWVVEVERKLIHLCGSLSEWLTLEDVGMEVTLMRDDIGIKSPLSWLARRANYVWTQGR